MNTELRGYNSEVDSSEPPTPHYKVCTSLTEGGFDQPPCPEAHQMHMNGAIEQFADVDRDTLEVVNGGLAMKKIFSPTAMPHQTEWPADATSDDIYTIVTEYSQLHTNLQPDEDANFVPNCSLAETDEYYSDMKCGLYGHCGSKISPKHEFSIMHHGAPAYGYPESSNLPHALADDRLSCHSILMPSGPAYRDTVRPTASASRTTCSRLWRARCSRLWRARCFRARVRA